MTLLDTGFEFSELATLTKDNLDGKCTGYDLRQGWTLRAQIKTTNHSLSARVQPLMKGTLRFKIPSV